MFKESRKLLLGPYVFVGSVHTAGATVVHQFCHLGSFSFLGGGSLVLQDVPKYTMVAGERAKFRGLNLVGLARRGFSTAEIRNLKAAYRKIFMRADVNAGSFEDRLAEVVMLLDFVLCVQYRIIVNFVLPDLRSGISRNFQNARQEDAHEYMVNLLESMHKCCLPSGVPSESHSAYEKSFVHKIFGGHLRSQVKCKQCSFCSNMFDPFLDLSLEIFKAESLQKALANIQLI
ncbi:Ubiquitin carboxyl-terminal hydrolase [Arachis hypogaea]|nr:Ubiquitin carboxyl-terminal hydrolase [Arachis hypogaea]